MNVNHHLEAARDLLAQNAPITWLLALGLLLGTLLLGLTVRGVVRRRFARLAETERLEIMEVPLRIASRTTTVALFALSIAIAASALARPVPLVTGGRIALTIVAFWQLGVWGSAAVLAWLDARKRSSTSADRAAAGSLSIIGFILQLLVWALVLLLALDNLGIDITALVAGLGVGGIAVALAVQNVLGDLFASLSITLDRPFVVGDFIVLGEWMGTVEQIGVKSTRLRSLGGEQIILANADLLGSRVRNFGRMQERRVVFTVGVTYETARSKLERIPQLIRAAVEAQPDTRFDRSHFANYGSFSLDFETVYYVLSPDFSKHMDVKQAIYFAIHEAFERDGIEFAYPTQKLWHAPIEQPPAEPSEAR